MLSSEFPTNLMTIALVAANYGRRDSLFSRKDTVFSRNGTLFTRNRKCSRCRSCDTWRYLCSPEVPTNLVLIALRNAENGGLKDGQQGFSHSFASETRFCLSNTDFETRFLHEQEVSGAHPLSYKRVMPSCVDLTYNLGNFFATQADPLGPSTSFWPGIMIPGLYPY